MYKVTGILPRQSQVYLDGIAGQKPLIPTRFDRLEELAQTKLSEESWASIAGAAGSETTMALNRTRLNNWAIVPRVLKDTTTVSTATEILRTKLSHPFMIAPVASQDLAHREAELATAKAAASEDIPMIVSMQATKPMEMIYQAMGNGRRWQQIYWSKSDQFNRSIIQRAEAGGCRAIVVTLDTQVLGWRPRDLDLGFSPSKMLSGIGNYITDPVFNSLLDELIRSAEKSKKPSITLKTLATVLIMSYRYPGSFFTNLNTLRAVKAISLFSQLLSKPGLSWEDLVALKKSTKLPIIVKGIIHPEDAKLALKHGLNGIVVSNHGGRQLASCLPTVDALPDIASAVKGKLPILFDSGIQNGDDIFKAIALGADAVLIGRPFMYALAIAGESGLRELLQNLKTEFELLMILSGCTQLADITADRLKRLNP
jgi:lactate 2-monooxygenase